MSPRENVVCPRFSARFSRFSVEIGPDKDGMGPGRVEASKTWNVPNMELGGRRQGDFGERRGCARRYLGVVARFRITVTQGLHEGHQRQLILF